MQEKKRATVEQEPERCDPDPVEARTLGLGVGAAVLGTRQRELSSLEGVPRGQQGHLRVRT